MACALEAPPAAALSGATMELLHFDHSALYGLPDEWVSERKIQESQPKSAGAEIFRRQRCEPAAEIELKLHCARPGQEVESKFGGDAQIISARQPPLDAIMMAQLERKTNFKGISSE
jgi:hypothetical protein